MSIDQVSDFIAGWAAGAAGLVVGHPMDTIKVRLQTSKYGSTFECVVQTIRQETLGGFYKGMFFPFMSAGFLHSIYFAGYRTSLQLLNPEISVKISHHEPSHLHVLTGSLIGGFLQWIPSCPIEVVKVKLQVQKEKSLHLWQLTSTTTTNNKFSYYRSPFHCFMDVYRKHGFRQGLYKGGTVMLVRDLIAYGFYLPVYEFLFSRLNADRANPNHLITAVSGGVAGVASWMSILPFDLVKSRMQVDDQRNPKYKGILHCALSSYRSDGIMVFYRGWTVVAARAFPVNAVIFLMYDQILRFIYHTSDSKIDVFSIEDETRR